jgi:hypothetical protein
MEVVMSWKKQIPGCFGTVDCIFAMHPLDHERAQQLLVAAIKQKVSAREYRKAIKDYLISEGCGTDHIKEQLTRAMSLRTYFNNP